MAIGTWVRENQESLAAYLASRYEAIEEKVNSRESEEDLRVQIWDR
jgi:hypothetical protein